MKEHAMNLLRERHVVKALRKKIEESARGDEAFSGLLQKVYGGKSSDKKPDDTAGIEEEMRARLLKAGAPAFVPEDEKAFMNLDEIMKIIQDAGGIPTYPILVDAIASYFKEQEPDLGWLAARL